MRKSLARARVCTHAFAVLLVLLSPSPSRAGQRVSQAHHHVVPRPRGLAPERIETPAQPAYAMRPERDAPARPVGVYLHGICGEPSNGCPYFRAGDADDSWLACPSAPVTCEGGGATWTATAGAQRRVIEASVNAIASRDPSHADAAAPSLLVGFSQGAYVARNLLRTWRHRFRAVVFVGANIDVDANELRAAGIERAVFAAGRFDGSRAVMVRTATRLRRAGFAARFVDLGAVGHTYVPERGGDVWREALAWARST